MLPVPGQGGRADRACLFFPRGYRRAKLTGIDAPAKAEVAHILATLPTDTLDAEIRRLEAEVERQAIEGGDGG